MSYPPDSLGAQLNRVVELRFSNGEVVHVKLLAIDPDDQEDVTYEVLQVVARGDPPARSTQVGATIIAELHELEHWRLIG